MNGAYTRVKIVFIIINNEASSILRLFEYIR